jgi:hypothetical protein
VSGAETFPLPPCFVHWKQTREIDVSFVRNPYCKGLDRGPIATVIVVYGVAFWIAALTMSLGIVVA